jgi:hypothetical protein
MSLFSHLFAGFTDYFRAYTAKSYKDVLQRAAGRFDPAALRQNRLDTIREYRQQLAQNPNLTSEDIDTMVFGRMLRHQAGDAIETVFGRVGQLGSIVGGTLGYGSKHIGKFGLKLGWGLTKYGAIVGGVGAGVTVAAPVVVAGGLGYLGVKAFRLGRNLGVNAAVGGFVKSTGKFIGKGVAEYSTELAKDSVNLAKFVWQNRNSRGFQVATVGAGLALAPVMYEHGQEEAKYQHKMRQIASNWSVSDDGGGTFLRPNFRPSVDHSVDNHGATGDLVFALHSLRHGG